MTLNTPQGKVNFNTTETYTAAELGTDIYPGAQSVKGGMRMELPTGSMVTGVFVTSDSKDQVVAFYKNKFGSGASTFDTADGAILTLPMGDKESVMVTVTARRRRMTERPRWSSCTPRTTRLREADWCWKEGRPPRRTPFSRAISFPLSPHLFRLFQPPVRETAQCLLQFRYHN